jgi:DnaJ-class molecular chaperone
MSDEPKELDFSELADRAPSHGKYYKNVSETQIRIMERFDNDDAPAGRSVGLRMCPKCEGEGMVGESYCPMCKTRGTILSRSEDE